jgi:hypothetical protein
MHAVPPADGAFPHVNPQIHGLARYNSCGTQEARPFPSGLMIGFRATAITEDITVDGEELLEARWFTRPSYASVPRITRSAAPTPLPATCSAPG